MEETQVWPNTLQRSSAEILLTEKREKWLVLNTAQPGIPSEEVSPEASFSHFASIAVR